MTAAGTKDVTITSNSDWRVTTSDVLVTSLTFTPTTGNNTTATSSGGSITLDATGEGTLAGCLFGKWHACGTHRDAYFIGKEWRKCADD